MKKISIILSVVLAWIGVSTATAQLSNADQLAVIIGSETSTSMTTGTYYVIKCRSNNSYLIDNDGTFTTTTTAPSNGDADADGVAEYLFTRTSAGYIQSAAGNNLPALTTSGLVVDPSTSVTDGQLVKRKVTSTAVYTITSGASTGYVGLQNNNLYLNCDIKGVGTQANYTDWSLTAVDLIDRSASTEKAITYIYMYGTTEWYRETQTVNIGDPYPDLVAVPSGVKYSNVPSGTVTTSSASSITIQCAYTGKLQFTPSDSYASATWYYLSLSNNKYYLNYSTAAKTKFSLSATTATNSDAYKWAFVGNPFTGYKLMNKSAGSSYILTSEDPTSDSNTGGSTYPHMATSTSVSSSSTLNTYWTLKESGLGYLLARQGETVYCNNRSKVLAFWTSGADQGSRFCISPVESYTATSTVKDNTGTTISSSKTYRIINRKTGNAMAEVSASHAVITLTPSSADSLAWTISNSGTAFTIKNSADNYYISTSNKDLTGWGNYAETTSSSSANLYFYQVETVDDVTYYRIATSSSLPNSGDMRTCLGDDGTYALPWGTAGEGVQWYLEEVTTPTYVSSITSGKYYRLHNYMHTTKTMTDNGGTISGVDNDDTNYSQVWQITKSGSNYTMKNVLTGYYVQNNTSNSTQTTTGSSSFSMSVSTGTDDDGNTYFLFSPYLHCASSQSYMVVYWYASSAEASRWYLEEVSLSSAELTEISNMKTAVSNASSYTSTLSTYFNDYACTSLKTTYASMTDTQLKSAMSSLPTAIQEMAVKVKNDSWNTDAAYSKYEKSFRIADYEVYSNCDLWKTQTKVGPFARLFNPTGIQCAAGDLVYIFVDADAASNTSLYLDLVSDTNRYPDMTYTLKKGCNAVYVSSACELFVDYINNDTTKSCNDIAPIKIHIEGATCNGMWDMHRGMSNNDWTWLTSNMFTGKFLHVKGNSVLLNLLAETVRDASNVKGTMGIWDFVFDEEEKLTGCKKWIDTGKYKMMINSRYSYSGNPNWDGGHGTNHPTISSSYLMNYETLLNTGCDGGAMWELSHEMGHAHQYPILMAGTTEGTNNSLAQCVNYLWGKRSCRGDGVKGLCARFNDGYSWIDYAGMRTQDGDYNDVWISNKWFFQLWLYFDVLGNYKDANGENDGYAFVSALCDKLRNDPITYGYSATSPAASTADYLKVAKYAAEVAQADLSEYFQVWGFWETEPTVSNDNDVSSTSTWYIGDYGGYYLRTSATDVASVKAAMQKYTNKCSNIMFIEDRADVNNTLPTYSEDWGPTLSTDFGDVGFVGTYNDKVEYPGYSMSVSGTTVTMSGSGAVGYKIYDSDGNLVYISNFNSFTVSSDIATGLQNGTYTMKIAQGDGSDYAVGEYAPVTLGPLCKLINKMDNGDTTVTPTIITTLVNKIATAE